MTAKQAYFLPLQRTGIVASIGIDIDLVAKDRFAFEHNIYKLPYGKNPLSTWLVSARIKITVMFF
jgi:hypothetical protein